MPSLPRKNTLDYNPDSLVNASKKIRTIALENMKNPTLDPDQATLSSIDATRRLGDSIDTLDYLAGLFHSAVLRIQNLTAPAVGGGKKKKDRSGSPVSGIDAVISPYKDSDKDSDNSSTNTNTSSAYNRRIQAMKDLRGRFTERFLETGSLNPQSVGSVSSETVYPASSRSSSTFSSLGNTTLTGFAYDQERDFDDNSSGFVGEYDNTSWVASIFYLIQLTRKMDILVVSKIKPVSTVLTQAQITKLNDIYKLVKTSYDDITDPFTRRRGTPTDPYSRVGRNIDEGRAYGMTNIEEEFIRVNEYGDEIINTFNSERKKLLLDITVVVNSWKQNSATGQQTEMAEDLTRDYETTAARNRQLYIDSDIPNPQGDYEGAGRSKRFNKSGRLHLIGGGNNFYGEKNDNSNDVPCLLSSIKNCPTKYLL